MNPGRTRIAAAIVLTALAPLVAATIVARAAPVPLTGTWAFTIQADDGSTGTPTVTFTQEGTTLTGRYSGVLFGDADLKGTVMGASIAFTVFAQWQGQRQDLIFAGDYDGSRAIKGSYSTDFGEGAFTATRK